jgi:putative NADH-flavin reductase
VNIALIGATGMIGSRILDEAVSRGHEVTAIVRDTAKVAPHERVTAVKADATDAHDIARAVSGADVVISAYSPGSGDQNDLSKNAVALIDGLTEARVGRVIVIGGAGSLEVAPGKLLVDTPEFPAMYKARAQAQSAQLDVLRASPGVPVFWTFVSPAAIIAPGERTGVFRVGGDKLMTDADGQSRISAEDFAIAIVDEAEVVTAPNRRISVAY